MSNRAVLALVAAIAFIGLLAFGLIAKGGAEIAVGEPAPDAPIERLDGEGTISLSDYRGEWVLVNFWASWCAPCETESPEIERFARNHRDDLTVLGINSEDNSVDAADFIAEYDLTWDMVKDTGDRSEAFGVLGFPESFLVDPDGNLALIRRGPVDRSFLDDQVLPLIEGQSFMRRRLFATVAACLLLSAVAAPAASAAASLADIEDEVMCTICGTTLQLSSSPQAERERAYINDLIAQGMSKEQIKAALVEEYGEEVLAVPSDDGFDLVGGWILPAVGVVVGAGLVIGAAWRWRRSRREEVAAETSPAEALPPDDEERLRKDLDRYA